MGKALVSLDTTLGSSIALRYINDISDWIQATLYGVHVVEPKQAGTEPGSGWVQKTWENALAESGKEDLRRFIEMERVASPLLRSPQMLIGDRTDQLLNELEAGGYALFMEGVPPTSNPLDFLSLLKSKLYRYMPCPVLVIKNLAPSNKIALLTGENMESEKKMLSCFSTLFNTANLEVDIIDMKMLRPETSIIQEEPPSDGRLSALKEVLEQQGVMPKSLKQIQFAPRNTVDFFREYGLVVSSLSHGVRKNDPSLIELMGRITSPVLICWDE